MTGAQYARIRRLLGLTQRQLAKTLGLHTQTIAAREQGRSSVTREMWLAITSPDLTHTNEKKGGNDEN